VTSTTHDLLHRYAQQHVATHDSAYLFYLFYINSGAIFFAIVLVSCGYTLQHAFGLDKWVLPFTAPQRAAICCNTLCETYITMIQIVIVKIQQGESICDFGLFCQGIFFCISFKYL